MTGPAGHLAGDASHGKSRGGDEMSGLLKGRVALVSGIGPGLGRSIARLFAAHGADLVLGARRTDHLRSVTAEVGEIGRRAVWRPTDITDPAQCVALAELAEREFGRIDILVNNAFTSGAPRTTAEDADLAWWRSVMEVNYWGALHMTRAAMPALKAAGDGRVVMINAMATRRVRPTWGAYVGSKSALAGITKTLAVELGPFGIRVNAIHPGYIYADAVQHLFRSQAAERGVDFQVVYDEVAAETCLKYLPDPDEIAGSVLFLASDLARPVTGESLDVNAGHWLR
jgi:NAD(P)-dependent dehydrogenase (short-subunit alcohol dehydrogenase family)